jgi:predicted PurR-regulated permease PerM
MKTGTLERSFFFAFLIGVGLLALALVFPFLTVIILGAAFAVILHPLFEILRKKVTRGNKTFASIITVLIFLILVCAPLYGIGVLVFNQSESLYIALIEGKGLGSFVDQMSTTVNNILPGNLNNVNFENIIGDATAYISGNIASIFAGTLQAIFSFLLLILTLFYFLKDGDHWRRSLILMSPLSDENDRTIIHRLKSAINGVMKGYLLIAILQGLLMGIGLAIFGVPNPALWGVLAGIASMIPSIGTALVSIPMILFLIWSGETGNAIGLGIWAGVLVGAVDNIINPIVVGGQTKVPPLLILLSVLGGISMIGPVGILIGPLTMSLLYALLSVYRSRFEGK